MEFYTVPEIQKLLKVGKNQAYRLVQQKDFPKIKVGSSYRIPKTEFDEWVKKQSYN